MRIEDFSRRTAPPEGVHTPTDLPIAPATPADIPALVTLVNNAYRGEGGWTGEGHLLAGSRTGAADLDRLLNEPHSVILKYTDDTGTIIGCVHLKQQDVKLYLGLLSVAPALQGAGTGKNLLEAARRYARKNGCDRISITVISVREELVAWYERHGFIRTGEVLPFHAGSTFGTQRTPLELLVLESPLGLQNRVDPFGRIIRTPARGGWMGNRGLIHDETREIVRPFRLLAWITCKLEFKGRQRKVMTPGLYTELFFLDEATSFAAGHRPCFECRREAAKAFKAFWLQGNPEHGFHEKTPIGEIDAVLQKERFGPGGSKITYEEDPRSLPDGAFVRYNNDPFLIAEGRLYHWTPFGYEAPIVIPAVAALPVLTPRSIVHTFRAGYLPQIAHHDA